MAGEYVFLTGATGFIGAHVLQQLLQKGYKVRFAARSASKAESLIASHPQHKDKLDYVIVEDIGKPDAYSGHLNGLSGVFHVASPFALKVENVKRDLVDPAINGVLNILNEASKVPSIKRVIITASFACMLDSTKPTGHVYSEVDYNPITYDEAVKSDSVVGYLASKRLAEKAAFDFVTSKKPHFDIVTLCPPMVYGPFIHPVSKLSELGESAKLNYELITGKQKIESYPFDMYIDVRDLAAAHITAFEKPEASNQRVFVSNGNYTFQEIVDLAHKQFPGQIRADPGKPGEYLAPLTRPNNKKSLSLGITYRPKEQTFHDSAAQFLQFEAQAK